MNNDQDAIFIRNFTLVLIFLVLVGIVAYILAKLVYNDFLKTQHRDDVVAERLAPVGQANIGEGFVMGESDAASSSAATMTDTTTPSAPAAAEADTGKVAYGKICFACHDAGIGGAPKIGDPDAWAGRLDKGTEMLVSNAMTGFQGETGLMPAKGGLPSLSDDDVRAAVDYMLASLDTGASSAPAPAAPASTAAPAEASSTPPATAAVASGRGKEVYDAACFVCHATGVAGAPKLGDAAGWSARIAQGNETMYTHAIKGFMGETGLMPPKGGRMDYSDDDVKAAVDYMVQASQ